MTKIALINDTHIGVRGDSQIMLDHQTKFFQDIFFPTLLKRGIWKIIHLGDLVDRRKNINFNTLATLRKEFLDRVAGRYKMDIICGNHDTYYKNTNDLNALNQLLGDYKDIKVYTGPSHVSMCDEDAKEKVLYIPWITPENAAAAAMMIENTTAKLIFGHLEISGFEMLRGIVCEHGLDAKPLEKFESVFSGHFHHKSSRNNIHYLGAPYQMTWNDFNSPRGFHIFDTETRELEFIENPYEMFVRISYRGTPEGLPTDVKGSYVKVVVVEKDDPYIFDQYISKLESTGPADIKIVEPLTQESNDDIISQAEDTPTIINNAIDQLSDKVINTADKKKLQQLMHQLYTDALNISTGA
jgi:DNA repair exonuclease SbcCD nuclease subunit